ISNNFLVDDDTHFYSNSSSFAINLNSNEISSVTSLDYFQIDLVGNESIYQLDLLIDRI
ncbi:unnamed protein product, partial [Rotaria sp. Silwood2]